MRIRHSEIRYDDGQVASFLYDGTGDLIKMEDWNGTTSISMDLLDRIVSVTDHKDRTVEYGWDAVGNKTSQGYPDGSQVDYWYDAENRIVQVQDFDDGVTLFEYDPNGNKIYKEYPNNETAWYSYDVCDQIIELDEYDLGGKKLFKTTYSWDAEGNRLSEMQYNHGQSGSKKENASVLDNVLSIFGLGAEEPETPTVDLSTPDLDATSAAQPIVNPVQLPDPTTDTAAGVFLEAANENIEIVNQQLLVAPEEEAGAAEPETESEKPETGKDDATIEGNGDGNGQVPPGQHEDEDGTIVNPGGNVAPGLNRGEKIDKPANSNKPEKPNKPGSEDKEDKKVNKAQQGTHIYTYDELNRMVTSDVSKVFTNYTYDTLGNLVLETVKNKSVDYEYNELNQLVKRTTTENETFTYSYDKRGNRVAETGKKESREYVYDATNRLVEGTNWKGDKSAYTYNGLGLRVNNLVTTHAGKTYDRDYVIDYTSPENDDLYVYAMGNGQLEYEQRHVYAGSERLEQITEKGTGGWERTLYVHEDVMGNTRYYTKATGQNFAELQYDAWGQPVSPNKLVNNDHGNYVFATFTGHIYDTTLDVYFAEARFYDAITRTWMAMDPIKSGLNWYQYVGGNPTTYIDMDGKISVHLNTGVGEGEPGYAYLTLYEDSYTAYVLMNVVDVFAFGTINVVTTLDYMTSDTDYNPLFSIGGLKDAGKSFGPFVGENAGSGLEKVLDKVVNVVGENTTLKEALSITKTAAHVAKEVSSVVGAVFTALDLTEAYKVTDDRYILTMMEDLGWVVQTGETEFVVDVRRKTTQYEQEKLFDEMVEKIEKSYSFMDEPIADFFHREKGTAKSDYEIYLEIKNLPGDQMIAQLNKYIQFYADQLTAKYTYNNRNITEAEKRYVDYLVRQYAQRLGGVLTRYSEVLNEFEKYICA